MTIPDRGALSFRSGSISTFLAEATRPFMSAMPSNSDQGGESQRNVAMCQQQTSRIERLDIYTRPLDHVGPLVCVGCDALSELGRGSRYHGLTQVDQPGL